MTPFPQIERPKICDRCSKEESVIEMKYCGLNLCAACFARFFERRVKRTIVQECQIQSGDEICVGLSGGKDSIVTLHLLNKFNNQTGRRARIFALTIDHGIKGHDEILLKNAKYLCQRIGIEHHVSSFKEEFGYSVDELQQIRPGLCNCGVFRRYLLNKKARELGANKLATGHNLDDEAESVLMNFILGDVRKIIRGNGIVMEEKFIPRIKPLRRCPEEEVMLYARLKFPELKFGLTCPYRGEVIRMSVKRMIDQLERIHPGIKFQVIRSGEKFRQALLTGPPVPTKLNRCKICEEPTSGSICNSCELLIQIRQVHGNMTLST